MGLPIGLGRPPSLHLGYGRLRRFRRIALAAWIGYTEIVFRVLIEVLGGDAIALHRRLPRECHIALEELMRIAAELYIRAASIVDVIAFGRA
jgi:hypothetical protein